MCRGAVTSREKGKALPEKGQEVKVRVEVKVKITFISISPLLSKVKVPHTSNADAVSRLTWIRKADHNTELRNVNSFTQSKILELNFTPRKARK